MRNKRFLPPTSIRVNLHTKPKFNKKIQAQTKADVLHYGEKHADQISKRINELQYEWDTERTLETNAAIIILGSTALGFFANPRWHILTGTVAAFLLQHALQGWCPPLSILRKLGFRTAKEIDEEIFALRLLRGDITGAAKNAQQALDQAKV